jgi:hypothetical protein
MGKDKNPASPHPTDAVGYRRPPRHSQFQPGCSGNPKGRPKGSRSALAIFQDIIRQKITVTENGRTRRIPVVEAMLRRLLNDALRGDEKALKLCLPLIERYGESPDAAVTLDDMLAEDKAILARYLLKPADGAPEAHPPANDHGSDNDGAGEDT